MKLFISFLVGLSLSGCMLSPRVGQSSRPYHNDISEVETLERLLQEEDSPSILRVQDTEPIRVGMRTTHVQRNLGLPDQREVAGNPEYGNERWTYEKTVPTPGGYYDEKRVIYFEGGTVVGWESN